MTSGASAVAITDVRQLVPKLNKRQGVFSYSYSPVITPHINPIDAGPQPISTVKGRQTITVLASDTNFMWSIDVDGGYNRSSQRNFYYVAGTAMNCTVLDTFNPSSGPPATPPFYPGYTSSYTNTILVTTPNESLPRQYTIVYSPANIPSPTTIMQTGPNTSTGTTTITVTDYVVVPQS